MIPVQLRLLLVAGALVAVWIVAKQIKNAGKAGEGSALRCVTRSDRPRTPRCAGVRSSQAKVQSLLPRKLKGIATATAIACAGRSPIEAPEIRISSRRVILGFSRAGPSGAAGADRQS